MWQKNDCRNVSASATSRDVCFLFLVAAMTCSLVGSSRCGERHHPAAEPQDFFLPRLQAGTLTRAAAFGYCF